MKTTKILFCFLVLWLNIIWIYRIVTINKSAYKKTNYYEMNESFRYMDVEVKALEAHIYTPDEFEEKVGGVIGDKKDDDSMKIICMKLNIKNVSGKTISWDKLFNNETGLGFSSADKLWCGAYWPSYTANINFVPGEAFEDGEEVELWYSTAMNKEAGVSKKTWKNPMRRGYYYVFDTYPNAKKIRLKFD